MCAIREGGSFPMIHASTVGDQVHRRRGRPKAPCFINATRDVADVADSSSWGKLVRDIYVSDELLNFEKIVETRRLRRTTLEVSGITRNKLASPVGSDSFQIIHMTVLRIVETSRTRAKAPSVHRRPRCRRYYGRRPEASPQRALGMLFASCPRATAPMHSTTADRVHEVVLGQLRHILQNQTRCTRRIRVRVIVLKLTDPSPA
ncbi:hypothetical protein NM688_g7354 [Phlebia brevispora]|uniref:Uncharacterized protein n=1 Tax=Phlebia brevispora TaxID=194682 RepID=A0ACC1S6G5_9APHY|nr:hypothetical protein NM688_g7354 [Phlebia brevispora]